MTQEEHTTLDEVLRQIKATRQAQDTIKQDVGELTAWMKGDNVRPGARELLRVLADDHDRRQKIEDAAATGAIPTIDAADHDGEIVVRLTGKHVAAILSGLGVLGGFLSWVIGLFG